jgi:hypothetical protein
MIVCDLCRDRFGDDEILDHLAVIHPDLYGEVLPWPDGEPVIIDQTLRPADFFAPDPPNKGDAQ